MQSLHWVIEDARVAKKNCEVYLTYMDFDTVFNRNLNVPDIDLLQSLYQEAHNMADLPYGRSAPAFLTRACKQLEARR